MSDTGQQKQFYILRHGQAENGFPDATRELTQTGRSDLNQILTGVADRLLDIEVLIASSLVRAQQTAEIAKEILVPDLPIITSDDIRPWSSPRGFLDELDKMTNTPVMIVSHQPFVGELIAYFANVDIHMPPSSVAALQYEHVGRGCAELLWVESP